MRDLAAFELEARRGKYAQIVDAQAADEARMAEIAQVNIHRVERITEALGFLDALRDTGDGEAFASAMEHWCRKPGFPAFVGPNGQMFLKQLLKAGGQGEGVTILSEALYAPVDDDEAKAKLERVLDFIERVKQSGHPAPARTPFLLSFFWGMQDAARWPVAWASAIKGLYNLGWTQPGHSHADNYLEVARVIRSLGNPVEVAHALFWFDKHRFVGLAPSLVERCEVSWELSQELVSGQYPSAEVRTAASYNAVALTYETWTALTGLRDRLADALGRSVKLSYSKVKTGETVYRWWGWASATPDGSNVSLRIWVTRAGVLVGIHPGWARPGWFQEAALLVAGRVPAGYEIFEVWDNDPGNLKPLGTATPQFEFLVGRFYPGVTALDRIDLGDEVLGIAADLQPLFDELATAAKASASSDEPPSAREAPSATTGDLGPLVDEFKRVRGYPIPKDEQSKVQRAQWADLLTADELQIADLAVIRQVINSGKYGGPGPQSVLNATLGSLDAAGIERFFQTISELIWGQEDLAARIDRALDPQTGYKGLGEAVIMKLLAVTHPERVVPVFPYNGDMGKAKLMQLIGLTPPAATATRGQKQVASNDAIHEVLESYFPRDTWGQGQFLYWLRTRPKENDQGGTGDTDDVGALAAELYLPADTLQDWISLLEEKRQIIFYGPPGTGKTYVARKLAALVAGDPSRQRLVQFHPSTSYEDFFEGYRPETSPEGNLGYRLVPGPLALLAAEAEASPGVDHVMVIDEINRANLPKVFGELLFLLEYRDEQVQTLYRSEDAFELPNNLMFIGTMNTADKSIALIDAALRRRFHFIPFFPHEEPHNAVLAGWLEDNNSDALWVAGLVEHVNARLIDLLGGPHLQIGPSYFFDETLDEAKVRRIWRYSILPFIEDQLWGQTELLRTFEFDQVLKDYRSAGGESPAEEPARVTPHDSGAPEGDDEAP